MQPRFDVQHMQVVTNKIIEPNTEPRVAPTIVWVLCQFAIHTGYPLQV